jgi:hypothetical protein
MTRSPTLKIVSSIREPATAESCSKDMNGRYTNTAIGHRSRRRPPDIIAKARGGPRLPRPLCGGGPYVYFRICVRIEQPDNRIARG